MKNKILVSILIMLGAFAFIYTTPSKASADELSDVVSEELDNLDLSGLQGVYNDSDLPISKDFSELLSDMVTGNFVADYESFGEYVKNVALNDFYSFLPCFCGVVAIAILCSLMHDFKSSALSDGVGEIVSITGIFSILLIIIPQFVFLFNKTKNTIENIAKLNEIMSPIIVTLMVSSGGNVSASLYKPSLVFLSQGAIEVFSSIVLPIAGLTTIFSVVGVISPRFKFTKFSDFFGGIVKWITGLTASIFGVFLSVQGIASATGDGISIKAAKYVVSNSVPLVGGLLKDGFDLVAAGSVIIKNAVGIIGVFIVFFLIAEPLIKIAVFSLLLKATAAVTESCSFTQASATLTALSKSVTYLVIVLLTVGFMFFLTVLLSVITASAFL